MFEVRSDVATELDAKRAIDQGHVRRKASAEDGRMRNVVLQELKMLNKAMLKLIKANQIQDPADQ